jgi:uncharacterized LabA/DUF88 family protein
MLFVDGENFTIRAQRVAESNGLTLREGPFYKRDCFVWLPGWGATGKIHNSPIMLQQYALRGYYYTSLVGDDNLLNSARESVRALGFSPEVFKKDAQQRKAKGVDIALTKDMLSHAFQDHYEVAVLIAGDGDYVPLVEKVKSLGRLVFVWFFEQEGLNPSLRLASDHFHDLTTSFLSNWHDGYRRNII